MGVLVGVGIRVFVARGVEVAEGIGVLVGILGVGEASNATRVNSAATVSAAWVKAASGEAGVATWLAGRLHPTRTLISITVKLYNNFFMRHLLRLMTISLLINL
jgi:hypothetical protein